MGHRFSFDEKDNFPLRFYSTRAFVLLAGCSLSGGLTPLAQRRRAPRQRRPCRPLSPPRLMSDVPLLKFISFENLAFPRFLAVPTSH